MSDTEHNTVVNPQSATPPQLPVDLSQKRLRIAIPCSIVFITSGLLPVVLYLALKYGTHLSIAVVLAIPIAIFGVFTLFNLFRRGWALTKIDSTCRVMGGQRWTCDYFHWNICVGFIPVTVVAVIGTALQPSNPRLLALPLTILMIQVCSQLLVSSAMVYWSLPVPFRFSSVARGMPTRPGIYTIVEDVVAVEGGKGTLFREAWDRRYRESKHFRQHLLNVNLFWGTGGFIMIAVLFALIFAVRNVDAAFVIGWIVPWIWAGLSAVITIFWTKRALQVERRDWQLGGSTV